MTLNTLPLASSEPGRGAVQTEQVPFIQRMVISNAALCLLIAAGDLFDKRCTWFCVPAFSIAAVLLYSALTSVSLIVVLFKRSRLIALEPHAVRASRFRLALIGHGCAFAIVVLFWAMVVWWVLVRR